MEERYGNMGMNAECKRGKFSVSNRNFTKGSFTIEASVIMGVFLFMFLALFRLFFFVHNKAWLTCAAYEAAVTGSMAGELSGQDANFSAWWKANTLKNAGLSGLDSLDLQVQVTPLGKVEVSYFYQVPVIWQQMPMQVRVSAESRILRPTAWIRQVKAAGGVFMRSG